MNRDLQAILLRDNPGLGAPAKLESWLQSHVPVPYFHREIAGTVRERWVEAGRAHLVIGPRQAGKSTLLWAHLAAIGEPVLFVDCEQAPVREWCRSAPLFLDGLEEIWPRPVTLFFDEAQYLDEAGLFVKGLVDRRFGAPIFVTGSSSYHLGARTRESLAGRATRTRLLPFSLEEVGQEPEADRAERSALALDVQRAERFERHFRFGGYPEVWQSSQPERLLTDLVEAVILRDASDLHRIGRPDAFRRLLQLAAGQAGQLVNLSEWASLLGVSRDTVASYVEILESGHILALVPPFAGGRRSELTRQPKVFFVDNGIRHRLVHDFGKLEERQDRGPALENWVFSELWKALPQGATLHFWRSTSGAEVDFVIARGTRLVGVEVKAGKLGRPKLERSARSFLDAYQPERFLVVNTGIRHDERLEAVDVSWISPVEIVRIVAAAWEPVR